MNKNKKPSLLLHALVNPEKVSAYTLADWDLLIRQGRSIDMLARLYVKLRDAEVISAIPSQPLRHMCWAYQLTQRHKQAIRLEVEGLMDALAPLGAPVVLLKGAAYSYGGLAPAEGRLFSDIDILLPEGLLPAAEKLLQKQGWLTSSLDEYDQNYYRRWMHELPPLTHGQRQTELDVHHAILPKTAKVYPSSQLLLADIVYFSPSKNLYRLGDADLILHSATHLFFDGEMQHGLRDLEDIDSLFRVYCQRQSDWLNLLARGEKLQLSYPLFYAMHYCGKWFETPIPADIYRAAEALTKASGLHRKWMTWLFDRGLMPDHPSCYDRWTAFARWVLYVRSHYLKMPMHLLIPHLLHKSFWGPLKQRWKERKRSEPNTLDKLLEEGRAADINAP
jgi:hypothetical protein